MADLGGKILGARVELACLYGADARPRWCPQEWWLVAVHACRGRVDAARVSEQIRAARVANGTATADERFSLLVALGVDEDQAERMVMDAEIRSGMESR